MGNSSKQTAFISTSSPSLSLVSKTITKPSPCTKLRPENLCPHKTTKMRFTALLTTCLPCRRHLSTGPQFPPLGSLLACWHRHRVSITPLQRRLCPEHRHLWSNRRRRISVLLCSLCRWLRNRRRNQHGWIPHKRSWQCRC